MYTGSGPYGTNTVIQAPFTGSTVSYSPIFTTGQPDRGQGLDAQSEDGNPAAGE